jgi:hypothetical protein
MAVEGGRRLSGHAVRQSGIEISTMGFSVKYDAGAVGAGL